MKAIVVAFMALIVSGYANAAFATEAYYSVIFDERGLANTLLRLDYVNNGDTTAESIVIRIRGENPSVAGAYLREGCAGYRSPGCEYGYRFLPLEVTRDESGAFSISLNSSIPKGGSAELLVYYRSPSYTRDGLFGKEFGFETPEFGFDVDRTRVAIDVDEDLTLKEGGSGGSYGRESAAVPSSSGGAQLQQALSSSYSYAYYAKGYVMQKSVLLAGETFTMRGTYGRNPLLLYFPEIAGGVLVAAGAAYIIRKKNGSGGRGRTAKGTLTEAAVFSFVSAALFAMFAGLVLLGIYAFRVEDVKPVVGAGLLAWLASIGFVFFRKHDEGFGLVSACMFIGFSLILTPLALWMALIGSLVFRTPYY